MATKKVCCIPNAGSVVLTPYAQRKSKTANGLAINELQMFGLTYETQTLNGSRVDTRTANKVKSECQEDIVTAITLKISSACLDGYFAEAALAAGIVNFVEEEVVEQFPLWKGQIISLSRLPKLDEDIVITNIAGSTTYVEGVDYEFVYGSGKVQIRSLANGTIPNPTVTSGVGADNVEITYINRLSLRHVLGALVNRFFRVEVAGLSNQGESYKEVFYKARFKPNVSFDMITDGMDSAVIEAELDVYLDESELNTDNGLFIGFGEIDMSLLEEV